MLPSGPAESIPDMAGDHCSLTTVWNRCPSSRQRCQHTSSPVGRLPCRNVNLVYRCQLENWRLEEHGAAPGSRRCTISRWISSIGASERRLKEHKGSRCAAVFALTAHSLARELHQGNTCYEEPSSFPEGSVSRLLRSQSVASAMGTYQARP